MADTERLKPIDHGTQQASRLTAINTTVPERLAAINTAAPEALAAINTTLPNAGRLAPVTGTAPAAKSEVGIDNPYAINSILDALANTAALKRKYGNTAISTRGRALLDLFKESIVQPVQHGQFGVAGLNVLTGVGETVDVLDNIAKSVMTPYINKPITAIDYDTAEQILQRVNSEQYMNTTNANGESVRSVYTDNGTYALTDKDLKLVKNIVDSGRTVNPYRLTTSERIKSSIGIGDYGRINYNYATGNVIGDMLCEVALSPSNWVTLGATAADKQIAAGVVAATEAIDASGLDDLATKTVRKIALDISAQDGVRESLVREALDVFKAKSVKVHSAEAKRIMSLLSKEAGNGNQFAVNDLGTALTYVLAQHGYGVAGNAVDIASVLNKAINNNVNRMSITVMKSLDALSTAVNNIPLDLAGIRPAAMLINKGYKKTKSVANWIMSQYDNGIDAYSTDLLKGLTPINYNDADAIIDKVTDIVKGATGEDGVGLRAILKEAYIKPKCEEDILEVTKLLSKEVKSVQDIARVQFNVGEYLTKKYGASLEELQEIAHNNLLKDATETNTRYYQFLSDVQAYFAANETELARADISLQIKDVRRTAVDIADQLKVGNTELADDLTVLKSALISGNDFDVDIMLQHFNKAVNSVFIESENIDPALSITVDAYHTAVNDLVWEFTKQCTDPDANTVRLIPDFIKNYSDIAAAFSKQLQKQTKLLYGVHELNNFVSNVTPLADKAAIQQDAMQTLSELGVKILDRNIIEGNSNFSKVLDFEALEKEVVQFAPEFQSVVDDIKNLLPELGIENSDLVRNQLKDLEPIVTRVIRNKGFEKEQLKSVNLDVLSQAIDALDDPEEFITYYEDYYNALYSGLSQLAESARHSDLTIGGNVTARILESANSTEEAKELASIRERLYDLSAELKDKTVQVSELRKIEIAAEQQKLLPREHALLLTVAKQDQERRAIMRAAKDFSKEDLSKGQRASIVIEKILGKLDTFAPEVAHYAQDNALMTKNTITLKIEQFQSFMRGLASDEANAVFQAYEPGAAFRNVLDNILADSTLPDQIHNTANELLQYAKERSANLEFVRNIKQADIPESVKIAILQSTQKYYYASPKDFMESMDYFIKRISDDVDMFVNSRDNPVTLTLDNFYQHNKEAVNELRIKAGLEPLDAVQTHTALDDDTINLVLTESLVDKDVQDKFKIIQIDSETNGATKGYRSTSFHQLATVSRKTPGSDELVMHQYTIGTKFLAQKDMPSASYLQKLYPDVPFEERAAKYIAERTDPNGLSERDMLIALLNDITQQCADHFNPMTRRYNVILAGNNISGFDIQKLRNQIKLYGIESNEVFDLHILDKVDVFDTLATSRKVNGFYSIKEDATAYSVLDKYLRQYAEQMCNTDAGHVFSTFSAARLRMMNDDLTSIAGAILPNAKRAKAQRGVTALTKDQMEVLQSIHDQQNNIKSMLEDLRSTWQINQKLKRTPIVLEDVFYRYDAMPDTIKERLLQLYKAQGMSDAEAVTRLEATTPTNLLKLIDHSDMYGWKYQVDNHKMINYFDMAKITADDKLSYSARVGMTKFSAMLDRFAENAHSFDLTAEDYQQIHNITRKILEQEPEFVDLKPYFRQDMLTGNQELAFFNYCFNKLSSHDRVVVEKGLRHVTAAADRILDYDITPRLQAYLQTNGDPIKTYIQKWVESDFSGILPAYQKYSGIMKGLTTHQTDLEATSRAFGRADLISSSTQARLEAVTPAMKMAENITYVLSHSEKQELEEMFYQFTTNHAEARINGIAKHFSELAPDDMAQWLASSGSFVMLPNRYISKELAPEFLEKNIVAEPFGSWTVVYLNKNSGYLPQSVDIGNGAMRTRFAFNGTMAERYTWAPSADIESAWLRANAFDVDSMNNTAHALQFMSDGAANASTLDMIDNSTFMGIYDALPDSIKQNMVPRQMLDTNVIWEGNNFNHTVLAPYATRKELLPYAASDYCHSLVQATVNASKSHNAALTYAQAMLSDTSRIGKTALAAAIREDHEEAIRYFSNHPEYTLCTLAPAKNAHGIEIRKFEATNILQALDNDAHILPTYTYDKLYKVINGNQYSEGAMGAWRKFVSMYKIGYLANPGTWGRNSMDAFIKTMASTDANVVALGKEWAYAIKECADYDSIMEMLIKTKPQDMALAKWLENKGVKDLFAANNFNIDYDRFTLLYRYMQESAAGGEIKCLTDYTSKQRLDYLQKLYNNGFLSPDIVKEAAHAKSRDDLIALGLGGMNYTERIARMAQFNYVTKRGGTFVDAMQSIAKTQFNYDNKSKFEQTVELLLPFFTFANRNLTYWMDQFEVNPRFIKELSDVLYPLWQPDQYDSTELQENSSLQRNVLNGNIPIDGTDYFLATNLSVMDTLNWLTDPINHTKQQVFAPVQALMDVILQNVADDSYHQGAEAVSNWIQETFGAKPTMQQLQDKYGAWTEEYLRLTNARVSSEDTAAMLKQQFFKWQLLPVIGTQIQRLENTGLYYNDNALTALGYASGLISKAMRYDESETLNKREKLRYRISSLLQDSAGLAQSWSSVCQKYNINPDSSLYSLDYTTLKRLWDELSEGYKPINSRLYALLQSDDDSSWMYTRLKNALGYQGVSMKDIPNDAKLLIEQAMKDPTNITATVLPVLQDGSTMTYMWKALKRQYGVTGKAFTDIPTQTLDKMYSTLAESAMAYGDIITTLQNSPSSRYTYSIVKKRLGYATLKLGQLPCDALKAIQFAIHNQRIGVPVSSFSRSSGAAGTTARARRRTSYVKHSVYLPYEETKAVYKNYDTWYANRMRHQIYRHQYIDNHSALGVSNRIKAAVNNKISPIEMKYRLKDMYYYFKY